MGALAVGIGKVQEALPFFKAALESNPNIVQYWLSYIDALIKLERMDEAKAVFDQAKSKGATGEGFVQIAQRLGVSDFKKPYAIKKSVRSLKAHINSFYTRSRSEILANASVGWLYNIQFDNEFLAEDGMEIKFDPKNTYASRQLYFEKEYQYHEKHHYESLE